MEEMDQSWEELAGKVHYKPAILARECGVSLRTLQRHFRKSYGTTASGWLRQTRMREAYSRLKAGARVKEVAIDLGYKQMSHFSRDFKSSYGISPSEIASRKCTWPDADPEFLRHVSMVMI